jgi:hypothetical protein
LQIKKGNVLMKKLSIRLGTWGAALGMLVGLIELGFGAQIRTWIGNKENPAILGVVTFLLSGMALKAVLEFRKRDMQTNDRKLALFIGVLLPAAICFTTVGRLWYLPGSLLMVTSALLAYEFWINAPQGTSSEKVPAANWAGRLIGGIGSLVILGSVGMAFRRSQFGLFQIEILVRADRLRLEIVPMDILRRTALSFGSAIVENLEVSQVMVIYLLLILGAVLALVASLTASRLFTGIGGGIAFIGLLLYLVFLPGILAQANYTPNYTGLLRSLGWGWYLSMIGASLILATSLFRPRPGI